jgi:hypothetical protein
MDRISYICRTICILLREAEFGDDVGVAVVVAGVEEVGFFLLKVVDVELNDQGGDKGDEGGFESGGEAAGDALQGFFHLGDFSAGLEGLTETSDGLTQTLDGADEAEDRDGPDKAVDEGVAGGDFILVLFGQGGYVITKKNDAAPFVVDCKGPLRSG